MTDNDVAKTCGGCGGMVFVVMAVLIAAAAMWG